MVKHNNAISDVHFRKDWQRHVYTWFDQPGQKKSRRLKRQKKAAKVFPRPVKGYLRPIVRCPSTKYNTKVREGYGFTHEELRAAGVNRRGARQMGISVDSRRHNRSNSSFEPNVERLKQYLAKLVLWPKSSETARRKHKERKTKKDKRLQKDDTETTEKKEESLIEKPVKTIKPKKIRKPETRIPPHVQIKGRILPFRSKPKATIEWRVIQDFERKGMGAYEKMVHARAEARNVGKKKKAEMEAAELAFKKAITGG